MSYTGNPTPDSFYLVPVSFTSSGNPIDIKDTTGYNSISVHVTSAGTTCTITYEASDDGTNYVSVVGTDVSSGSGGNITTSTTVGIRQFPLTSRYFRARISTYTSGTVTLQATLRSAIPVARGMSLNNVTTQQPSSDAVATSATAFVSVSDTYIFNGTTWDRQRSLGGYSQTATTGVPVEVNGPNSAAVAGIPESASTAVASAQVLKASAGNVYSVTVLAGASAGFLMLFNATAAPADGAVTPVWVEPVAANAGFTRTFTYPIYCSTGATLVFSTTGPFTKTASATAFLSGQAV